MIQVDLVDYSGLTDLGMQITKYVNRNLKDIIRVLIDVLEMLLNYGGYCYILTGCLLPRQIQTRKADKARKHGTFGTT